MLLNKMRSGAQSKLAKALFSVILLSAVMGLALLNPNSRLTGLTAGFDQNAVASVGGTQISSVTFDDTVRRVLSRQNMNPQTAYQLGLIDRILRSEIAGGLLNREAAAAGIQIGDKVIAHQISQIVAPYASDAASRKDALRKILMNQGMSEAQFVSSLRAEMSTGVLRGMLQSAAAFTPDQEARDLYQYQNEQRTVKTLVLPHASIKDYQEPTDAVLLPFYQAGQERYAIPETRAFSMAVLTQNDLKKTLDISDEELHRLYDADVETYTVPEQRVMEQAVFTEQAAAAAAAEKAKGGAALKDAAGDSFLSKDSFQKSGLPDEIAGPAFEAKPNDVIGPVETALGWHVLVLKEILPPKTRPFEEVKEDIRKEALQDKLADSLYATANGMDDELAGGAALKDVAAGLALEVKTYGPLRADGSTAENTEAIKGFEKDRPKILAAVFDLGEGESAPVMELADGSYAAVQVDQITAKSYKPFDAVKDDLKKVWIADQQEALNKLKVQDMLGQIAAGTKTLDDLAKDSGLSVQTLTVKRAEAPPAPLTEAARTKFFELDKDGYAVTVIDGGYALGQVTDIQLPDAANADAKDLEKITETATQGSQDEFFLSYLGYLYIKYGVTVNEKLLQTMYAPGGEKL